MSALFDLVQTLIAHLIGGTPAGTSATAITFADSWVGQICNAIIADAGATGTGVIAIFFVFSLLMAGFKLVHSLKRI